MTFRIAVAGCTGYAGGELLRLLLQHPDVTIEAPDVVSAALAKFRTHKGLDFGDCLILEIARYTKLIGRNFFHSYYKINKLAIDSAALN